MSDDIHEVMSKHLEEKQVGPVVSVLRAAAAYGEGDALAGAKLSSLDGDDYETLTQVFQDAGFDVSFNNRMSLVGFVSSPDTEDEELNKKLEEL